MWHKKRKDQVQNNQSQGYPEDISNNIYASGSIFRCDNGHWYDGEEYNQCPHCGSQIVIDTKPKSVSKDISEHSGGLPAEQITLPLTELTPPTEGNNVIESSGKNGGNGTIGIFGDNDTNSSDQSEENVDDIPQKSQDNKDEHKEIINEPESKEDKRSLSEAIKGASASSGEITTSYFKRISNERSASAKSETTEKSGAVEKLETVPAAEPVVGWLVCVKGSRFGESFGIYSGNNSIGRNDENRIVISMDNNISRFKHAIIVYEPKKRNFYLLPGDSSGLTYLNGDYVSESKMIKAYDMIGLGESKFMFVPLCGEAFSWEDYYKGE